MANLCTNSVWKYMPPKPDMLYRENSLNLEQYLRIRMCGLGVRPRSVLPHAAHASGSIRLQRLGKRRMCVHSQVHYTHSRAVYLLPHKRMNVRRTSLGGSANTGAPPRPQPPLAGHRQCAVYISSIWISSLNNCVPAVRRRGLHLMCVCARALPFRTITNTRARTHTQKLAKSWIFMLVPDARRSQFALSLCADQHKKNVCGILWIHIKSCERRRRRRRKPTDRHVRNLRCGWHF